MSRSPTKCEKTHGQRWNYRTLRFSTGDQKLMSRSPTKCEKRWFFIFLRFLTVLTNKHGYKGGTEIFSENPAVLCFLKFLSGTYPKVSERLNERFPSKSVTDGRTHGRTDKTDSIGPFGLQPGTKKCAKCPL